MKKITGTPVMRQWNIAYLVSRDASNSCKVSLSLSGEKGQNVRKQGAKRPAQNHAARSNGRLTPVSRSFPCLFIGFERASELPRVADRP